MLVDPAWGEVGVPEATACRCAERCWPRSLGTVRGPVRACVRHAAIDHPVHASSSAHNQALGGNATGARPGQAGARRGDVGGDAGAG